MLSRVCSAAVNGIDAFAVEVEVNCGYGETFIALVGLPDGNGGVGIVTPGKPVTIVSPGDMIETA